jgi:serine protease Do
MRDKQSLRLSWGVLVTAVVLGCLIGSICTMLLITRVAPALAQPVRAVTRVAPESERAIIAAIAKVSPAVVNINTIIKPEEPNVPPMLRQFFEEPFPEQGQASGVIIDPRGYVLTNNHVVANATSVKVTLADGRIFNAKVVGADPLSDVGVVHIEGKNLPSAQLGDSADVPVGGWLIAIGNPFGYENTVTLGVLSARNRRLRAPSGIGLEQLLQTDAAINPGNSGGALVDINGQVVGMPTAIIPYAQGIGFAIPAEAAKKVAAQLIETGHAIHPYLGVRYAAITQDVQSYLKLPNRQGVLVIQVEPDSPAAKAGIEARDIILRLGKREIKQQDDVAEIIRNSKVGEKLPVVVRRGGKQVELTVTIGERPTSLQ